MRFFFFYEIHETDGLDGDAEFCLCFAFFFFFFGETNSSHSFFTLLKSAALCFLQPNKLRGSVIMYDNNNKLKESPFTLPPHVQLHAKKDKISQFPTLGDVVAFILMFLPGAHEALEEFGGPELVHLPDHTDAHVSVPSEQPAHMFTVSCRRKKR